MMLKLALMACCLFCAGFAEAATVEGGNRLISLCYHNVKDQWDDDPMTVSTERLISHLSWLKAHHYHPVSVQDVLDAKAGKKPLPDKAVLLTFDDGYRNFYDKIYPVLKMFDYPAVFALVTSWMETPAGQQVDYGDQKKPREYFLSWKQVREMTASGLVEIASHSHDMHHGVVGNPQGNSQPAAVTRRYLAHSKQYETEGDFRRRVAEDLGRSAGIIKQRTGVAPRVMVWPYGAYSRETAAIADELGMSLSFGLQNIVHEMDKQTVIHRYLISKNASLQDFVYGLTHLGEKEPVRVAHVDLDFVYDDDAAQRERNLGKLLDRIKAMHINTVYLQAFADPDGDGNSDALYFPNRHLPMRADLFNRVAWQLRTRANVNVYAWMPVLAFKTAAPEDWWVHEWRDGKAQSSKDSYRRLSPFHPGARKWITEIYQDLAKYAHFSGVLFHDDAFLTDAEDASPSAQQRLAGLGPKRALALKTRTLTGFTMQLAEAVRYYRPEIRTARNLYAVVVMRPESRQWFAQSLADFLSHYDQVALMAMPYMEQADAPLPWLEALTDRVSRERPDALQKTVFELQSVDWRSQEKIPQRELAAQMELLQRKNALNYGYYPDDFHVDQPPLRLMKKMMSLQVFPYGD